MPKIIYNPKKCINCGNCVSICSNFFKINNKKNNEILLIGGKLNENSGNFEKEAENINCAKDAIDICPVKAINLKK